MLPPGDLACFKAVSASPKLYSIAHKSMCDGLSRGIHNHQSRGSLIPLGALVVNQFRPVSTYLSQLLSHFTVGLKFVVHDASTFPSGKFEGNENVVRVSCIFVDVSICTFLLAEFVVT